MVDPKLRLLVVEDMSSMRKVVIKACKEMGFVDISEAADGKPAWEIVQTANPPIDMIISDWNMPQMTGIELLKHCRGDARFKAMPFIMVTAETEPHQLAEAIKLGVESYVQKPVAPPILKEKIEMVLKKKGFWKDAA